MHSDQKQLLGRNYSGIGISSAFEPGEEDGISNATEKAQIAQVLLSKLLSHMSTPVQRWVMAEAHPATGIESADVHSLANDFVAHTKDWRLGSADVYGGQGPINNLAFWSITSEQRLRMGTHSFKDTWAKVPDDPQVKDGADGFQPLLSKQKESHVAFP